MEIRQTAKSYSKSAEQYEQKWKHYLEHTHQKLLEEFKSNPGDHLLDVSAGTGLLARELVKREYPFSRLCLNDISRGMLEIAEKHLVEHPGIEFTCDPSDHLIYKSSEFDSVICLNAFHNYQRKEQFVREMHRVIKQGGKLYLLDWNRKSWFRPVNYVIRKFTGEIIQTYSAAETGELLESYPFKILQKKEWRYRYWKLFLIVAEKESRKR